MWSIKLFWINFQFLKKESINIKITDKNEKYHTYSITQPIFKCNLNIILISQ